MLFLWFSIKKYLIDFAEGRISVPDFIKCSKEHPEIFDFLTNIADPKFKTTIVHKKIGDTGWPQYIPEELPFDEKLFLQKELESSGGMLGKYLNIHDLFSNVLVTAFPNDNIVIDETLSNKFRFMLQACPEYIGGEIPFITPGDIQSSQISYDNQALSSEGKMVARVCSKDSILQVCIGGSIGKAAITNREVCFNQQINAIFPIAVYSEYIYAVMQSPYFITNMKEQAGGTATPIINRGLWDSLLIPVAPLSEQHRIVEKQRELFDKITLI